jgi:uncharacterized oxidoreductase
MSTAMIAEGKIRVLMQQGGRLPEMCVLDAEGNATTDPAKFYAGGTILPFGGVLGYKGFALSLLVEILGSAMSGVRLTPEGEADDYLNGMFLLAMHPNIFGAAETFVPYIDEIKRHVLSSKPQKDGKGVVMPGALDFQTKRQRRMEGIPVSEGTWNSIVEAGRLHGVDAEEMRRNG